MFVKLATDFVCDHAEIFSITKNANDSTRIVFKDSRHPDLVVGKHYDEFVNEFLSTINPLLLNLPARKIYDEYPASKI